MKILITGVSGLLGLNAAWQLREQHEVVGLCLDHPVRMGDVDIRRIDLRDVAAVGRCLEDVLPDLVIHTAGLTNVDTCETAPELAKALNTDAACIVASAARAVSAALIHVSTDHLFDGRHAMCAETTAPHPLNAYARTKRDAEVQVAAIDPDAVIVRTNFYGWGPLHRQSFSDWILASLRAGHTLKMFHDVYFTPILVNDLVDLMLELHARKSSGLVHVAGSERLSKYHFACLLARAFGLDERQLQPVTVDGFGFRAVRPRDMSLDTTHAAALLGHPLPDARGGIRRLLAIQDAGVPDVMRDAVGGALRE